MTPKVRQGGVVVALGAALGGLASCTAADRAVLGAPVCAEATASPTVTRHQPGQAILMSPAPRSSLPVGPIAGWEQVVSVADSRTTLAAVHPDGTVSVVGVDHDGSLAGTGGGAEEVLAPERSPA